MSRILHELVFNPNTVYLMLLFGLWVGVTAVYMPGTMVLETLAMLAVVLSILVLAAMPTNWLAVILLIVGVMGFLVMPFLHVRFRLLAVGGLALQAVGSLFLFNDGNHVALPLIGGILLASLGYHTFILLPIIERHRSKPVSDEDDLLIGAIGRVTRRIDPIGTVYVRGEQWTARSETPLETGSDVIVLERNGLELTVEAAKHKRRPHPQEEMDETDISV